MTQAGRLGLRGLALLALSAAACRKPAPIDPAEAAFHQAITRFAETSALTKDLTYRDPRFDPILDALDHIPAESEPKASALALAERIRGARALASSQERSSELLQAQAEAPPAFEPQLRLPSSPAPKQKAQAEAQATPSDPGYEPGSEPVSGGPIGKPSVKRLPSWYAGYFGGSAGTGAGATEDGGATEAAATVVSGRPSPPASQPARKEAGKSSESAGPPPVFGVPGPAGSALLGKPGT